jgi:type II secretory pathway component PulF
MSENSSKGWPVMMVYLLVLHAVCGVIILWLLLKLVPGYEKIAKDFDLKLPYMTIMVIDLSALFARFWFVLVPGISAADIAIILSLNRMGRSGLMTTWGVLALLVEMLLIGIIVWALWMLMSVWPMRWS